MAESPALTTDALRRLDRANEALVAECMRAHGFAYVVVPPDPALADDRDFPYGIDDVDWARRHGLGFAIRAAAATRAGAANPNNRYAASLPRDRQAAYTAALFGTPAATAGVTVPSGDVVTMRTDGCLASAQQRLYGDVRRWFEAVTVTNNLAPVIEPMVLADPGYQQRLSAWSQCMAEQGYTVRGPAQLRAQLEAADPVRERGAAVAEATCVGRTALAALGRDLDTRLGAAVRGRYRADLEACRDLRTAALRRLSTWERQGAAG